MNPLVDSGKCVPSPVYLDQRERGKSLHVCIWERAGNWFLCTKLLFFFISRPTGPFPHVIIIMDVRSAVHIM